MSCSPSSYCYTWLNELDNSAVFGAFVDLAQRVMLHPERSPTRDRAIVTMEDWFKGKGKGEA